ncbi:hypothetical protein [Maricaulis sp.]|uniref:hypothetical protein n=1 Tax=Maricaulis sp. TaxID=1486257 RepID=UPI003A95C2D3
MTRKSKRYMLAVYYLVAVPVLGAIGLAAIVAMIQAIWGDGFDVLGIILISVIGFVVGLGVGVSEMRGIWNR